MNKIVVISLFSISSLFFAGCSKEQERHVKTPEELLEEELAKGSVDEPSSNGASASELEQEALEDPDQFDEENAEYELKRTSIGARSCPGVIEEADLKNFKEGTAQLSILFANDGRVKKVTIDDTYKDSPVGNCLESAYGSMQIRSYVGEERSVDWKIELKLESSAEEKKTK